MIGALWYAVGYLAGRTVRLMLAGAEALAQTPVPGHVGGEADPGTGSAPGSRCPSIPCSPARDNDRPVWEPHPCHAWEFTDTALAATLDHWAQPEETR